MEISRMRPGPPDGWDLCYFDAVISNDITVCDMSLRHARDGSLVVRPPNSRFSHNAAVAVAPPLMAQIRAAAITIYKEGKRPDDQLHAA
jgi:hypothetical protein